MKTLIFILSLLLVNSMVSMAQCGKKVILTASETIHIDSNGTVIRTESEKSVVQINQSEVNVLVNDEHKMVGKINSTTCNWSVPFKQGKTVLKAVMDRGGESKSVTIEIEGKDAKIILLFKMADRPNDTIKVVLDKFEEEKG